MTREEIEKILPWIGLPEDWDEWESLTDEEKLERNRKAQVQTMRRVRENLNRKWIEDHGEGDDPDEGSKRAMIRANGWDCEPADFDIVEDGDGLPAARFKKPMAVECMTVHLDGGNEDEV